MSIKTVLNRLLILSFLTISGCTAQKLRYQVDPEISSAARFATQSSLIAVKVVDSRTGAKSPLTPQTQTITSDVNEAETLRSKIIDYLKRNNYKIISDPLLADVALELDIEALQVTVTEALLKSQISVNSLIKVKLTQQGKQVNKSYSMNRTQDVANPVKSVEITGVVNQVLTQQLQSIWQDPELSHSI